MAATNADRVYQIVVDGFRAFGSADPESVRRAFLQQDLRFVGDKYECDGMYAIWMTDEKVVSFYDEHEQLLKTETLEPQPMKMAA